jgi:hypothetical protein
MSALHNLITNQTFFQTTREKLFRFSIYLLPFVTFAFWKPGYGFWQPAQVVLLLLGGSLFLVPYPKNKKPFSKRNYFFITGFWYLAILSLLFSFVGGEFVSLRRCIGVLVSLILLFLSYYTVSSFCNSLQKSFVLMKDFINVANFIALSVIIEYVNYNVFHINLIEILVRQFHQLLPYSHMGFQSLAPLRYKGILQEPGDIGYFCIPALSFLLSSLLADWKVGIPFYNNLKKVFSITLIVIACMLTQSSVVISLTVLVFFISLTISFYKKESINLNKFYRSLIAAFVIGAFVVFYLFAQYTEISEVVSSRLQGLLQFWNQAFSDNVNSVYAYSLTSNQSVRVAIKSFFATVEALQRNPLLGVGLGNFSVPYEAVGYQVNIETDANQHDGYFLLFRLLTEVGLLGTTFFILCFWRRVNEGIQLVRWFNYHSPHIINYPSKNRGNPKEIIPILLAACIAMVYAFSGQASYWYPILPILFGICPRFYNGS